MKSKLSIVSIRKRVADIKTCKTDSEAAHNMEDALHHDVLAWIAKHGDAESASFAKEALKAVSIDFQRWAG